MQRPIRVVTLIAMASLAGLCQSAAAQTILYVKADATGVNNGTSWADASTHPQAALTAAASIASGGTPVQIWVAAGTYMPDGGRTPTGGPHVNGTGIRSTSFQLLNNVALRGGFAGTESALSQRNIEANPTILSGDLAGNDGPSFANNTENAIHVVVATSSTATAVLDGFTITGGNANVGPFDLSGGGIMFTGNSSSPLILNCTILANRANDYGGGVYCSSNTGPTIINCRFFGNFANQGGAASIRSSTLTNCILSGNSANQSGGGVYVLDNSSVVNCTFSRNSALQSGGGLYYSTPANGPLTNSIVWNNSAPTNSQIAGSFAISYCDVQGGMLNADPRFVDADGADDIPGTTDDDLRLYGHSPCLDAGNNTSVPADTSDLDGDSNTTEPTPIDLAGC